MTNQTDSADSKPAYTIERIISGNYRVHSVTDMGMFGIVRREGPREWHAKIMHSDGSLRRYAGIWSTRKDAIEEVQDIIDSYRY